eukprot:CAMPEP_0171901550 /NCGR_PEP_ID=MMETSP0993-20121228/285_1 /TAXON_ID=483369 /ORGANISM="non described non described, Strain CCMP2098" /LENGTH=48 /DNA_ID= /DNA_START= /DNA_END= /DNA_ORIENTATION=
MTGYGNGNQVKPSTMAAAELKHWSGSQTNGGASISSGGKGASNNSAWP